MQDEQADEQAAERQYHHGNLRAALIEAGLSALEQSEHGDVSLRAIAREVGVSANAAYRHFADKNALLGALAAEGFRRFAQAQADALGKEADWYEARKASGRAYVQFAQRHPALFRLMFSRFVYASSDSELQQTAMAAFQGLLAASAKDAGSPIDSQQTLLTAVASWSLVHGLSHLLLDGQLAFFDGGVDAIIDSVLAMHGPTLKAATGANSSKQD